MFVFSKLVAECGVITSLILCLLLPVSAFAQSNNENFLTYEDPTSGFKIGYPSTWNAKQLEGSLVAFDAPKETYNDVYDLNAWLTVSSAPLPSTTKSSRVAYWEKGIGSPTVIRESSSTTLAGLPAYRIVVDESIIGVDIGMGTHIKNMEIWTVHGDKRYIVGYTAPTEKYESYLPIVMKMIDTLVIP